MTVRRTGSGIVGECDDSGLANPGATEHSVANDTDEVTLCNDIAEVVDGGNAPLSSDQIAGKHEGVVQKAGAAEHFCSGAVTETAEGNFKSVGVGWKLNSSAGC